MLGSEPQISGAEATVLPTVPQPLPNESLSFVFSIWDSNASSDCQCLVLTCLWVNKVVLRKVLWSHSSELAVWYLYPLMPYNSNQKKLTRPKVSFAEKLFHVNLQEATVLTRQTSSGFLGAITSKGEIASIPPIPRSLVSTQDNFFSMLWV